MKSKFTIPKVPVKEEGEKIEEFTGLDALYGVPAAEEELKEVLKLLGILPPPPVMKLRKPILKAKKGVKLKVSTMHKDIKKGAPVRVMVRNVPYVGKYVKWSEMDLAHWVKFPYETWTFADKAVFPIKGTK